MFSNFFIIVLVLIILSSIFALLVRAEGRREADRIEKGELSADDFDIIEDI
jgi:hypothetical protein